HMPRHNIHEPVIVAVARSPVHVKSIRHLLDSSVLIAAGTLLPLKGRKCEFRRAVSSTNCVITKSF
ncbi:MAG: hypothetical protein ACRD9L_01595, partial [Bryobacteraceae bacterium]